MRPLDWAPLAERDPLPGDPEEIRAEARDMSKTATLITGQVEQMRRLADDSNFKGEFAEALRSSGAEVIEKLEKVAARYTATVAALVGWATDLEDFQAATWKALQNAREAEDQRGRNPHADLPPVFAYQANPLTVDENAPGVALLAEARRDLQRALEQADERAQYWAEQIEHAVHDNLTDHFMDHVHGLIERNAGWIKKLSTDLGYVTTAAAAVAILVPGLNVAVGGIALIEVVEGAGMASAIGAGVGHATLFAGGEKEAGFDLALDCVGLRALGRGKALVGELEDVAELARGAGARVAGQEAEAAARRAAREAGEAAFKAAGSDAERKLARLEEREAVKRAGLAGRDASAAVREAPEAQADLRARVVAGDRGAANAQATINDMVAAYGHDAAVQGLAGEGERLSGEVRNNFLAATEVDLVDKAVNLSPAKESYDQFKRFVMSGGPLE